MLVSVDDTRLKPSTGFFLFLFFFFFFFLNGNVSLEAWCAGSAHDFRRVPVGKPPVRCQLVSQRLQVGQVLDVPCIER